MDYPNHRDALAAFICGTLLSACSGNGSNGSSNDAQPGVGGLPNYGYAGTVSYGGYAAFAGQSWGGVGVSSGGSSSVSDATGGVDSASSGGTTQRATTSPVTGGSGTGGASSTGIGVATGGRSSAAGASSTGGKASGGGTSTGGNSSSGGTSTGGKSSTGATFTGGTLSTGGAASTGGRPSTGGTLATGGVRSTGGAPATGGAGAFNWGSVTYSPTGGSAVNHQGHNTGAACLASCHSHNFQAGGTIYQSNGTTAAGNIQVGVIMNGTLFTAYSGSQGNFFFPISGTLNWATAQIAIRSATGTAVHPATSGLSGNCNSCHNSSNRIVVP